MSSVLSEPLDIEPVEPAEAIRVEESKPVPRWLRRAGMVLACATLGPVLIGFLGFFLGILFLPIVTLVALLFAAGGPSRDAEHALANRRSGPRSSGRHRQLHTRHAHV
jgi:hypothetical protein